MDAVLDSLTAGLPALAAQTATTFAILIVGVVIYMWTTPHKELALIRGGNVSAAVSFGGAIVGLAIPLAVNLAFSVSVLDILIWGAVALIFQLVAFRVVDLMLKNVSARIEEGDMATAVILVSVKLATAVINAAAISG